MGASGREKRSQAGAEERFGFSRPNRALTRSPIPARQARATLL